MGKVWYKKNEELKSKSLMAALKRGGGSIMVWEVTVTSGGDRLVFTHKMMNKELCLTVIENYLKQSTLKLGLGKIWIFQHDKNPKYTAH